MPTDGRGFERLDVNLAAVVNKPNERQVEDAQRESQARLDFDSGDPDVGPTTTDFAARPTRSRQGDGALRRGIAGAYSGDSEMLRDEDRNPNESKA